LKGYDEPEILPSSTRQICLIGADAGQWHAHRGQVTGVAVSGDGRWVVSGGDDGTIWIQDREHPQAAPQGWQGQSL
jgi:WD40 repeat protein